MLQDIVAIMFGQVPLGVLGALFLSVLMGCREAGAWLGRRRPTGRNGADAESEEGYVLSGVLGLLALLVAFTFSLALDRFDQRRDLVVAEANALGTFVLRTELLDTPVAVRKPLGDYVDLRLAFGRGDTSSERERRQSAAQRELWSAAVRALGNDRRSPLAGTLLSPLNEAFDLASARNAERQARLPGSVLLTLLLYASVAALVVGYAVAQPRLRALSYLLLALLTLSITLTLDLDRPLRGTIQVSQLPMEDVRRLLE